jgi:hypothetical protein
MARPKQTIAIRMVASPRSKDHRRTNPILHAPHTNVDSPGFLHHQRRLHQGLGNVPIGGELPAEESVDDFRVKNVVCRESLGGLLKHYERKAA